MRMFHGDRADGRKRVGKARRQRKAEADQIKGAPKIDFDPAKVLGAPLEPESGIDSEVPTGAETTPGTTDVERPRQQTRNVKDTAQDGGRKKRTPTYYKRDRS